MKTLIKLLTFSMIAAVITCAPALGSTISISDAQGMPGDTAVLITVSLENTGAWAGSELILEYSSTLLTLNRIEPAARLLGHSDVGYYEYSSGKVSAVVFDIAGTNLPADTGAILNVYFDVPYESPYTEIPIVVSEVTAVTDDLQYDPVSLQGGSFWIWRGFFCADVNGDNDPAIDISDLVYLVDYMFLGGPEPPIMEAADVNCSGGNLDISDLVYLVDYMFLGGLEPCAPCSNPALAKRVSEFKGSCEIQPEALSDDGCFRIDIVCDFETTVAGFQQEYSYDGRFIAIDSIVPGSTHKAVILYYHADGAKISLGMVDINGKGFIKSGKSHLASVYYHLTGESAMELPTVSHVFTKAADRGARLLKLEVKTAKTEPNLPMTFALHQNYPNPFNPQTIIKYDLPVASKVRITIYNILGQRVNDLVDNEQPPGFHQVTWDGQNDQSKPVASGVYFYRIEATGFTQTKKMLLLK